MKTAVFASSSSKQARLVYDSLKSIAKKEDEVFFMDTDIPETEAVAIDGDKLFWNGIDLKTLDSAYVYGFKYEEPVLPVDRDCDWSLWQPAHVIDQQKHSFLYSLMTRMAAEGVIMFNPTSVYVEEFDKYSQLIDFAEDFGAVVPDILCTNDNNAVEEFKKRHANIIWRTSTGRSAWQLFQEKQQKDLIQPHKPPVILAEVCEGALCRGYYINGKPVLTLENAPPLMKPVEELEVFRPVDDDSAFSEDVFREKGLNFAQVVYIKGEKPVIYDLDVSPVLLDMPKEIREYLVETLAFELLDKDKSGKRKFNLPTDRDIFVRDSLFLRRMMQIQFKMQATKYEES